MRYDSRRSWVLAVAVVAFAGLALAGCGSSTPGGSSSTTTTPNRSFTIETAEGSVSVSLDGQLPPHWPADFPVPPGATPSGSGSIGSETEAHMIGVFETTGTGQDAFNFYKNSSSLTVSNPKSVGVGTSFVGRLEFSDSHKGSVTVTDFNSHTYIVVYLNTSTSQTSPVSGDR